MNSLSDHPVGLVPSPWLSAATGISQRVIVHYAHDHGIACALTRAEVQQFPRWPSTFSPWVTAWGLDRVLAWLDEYATIEAAFVRANVDRLHDRERDEAERRDARRKTHLECVTRRNRKLGPDEVKAEKREAARKKQARRVAARREARIAAGLPADPENVYAEIRRRKRGEICAASPAGLVPDNVINRVMGIDSAMLRRYRTENGIALCEFPRGRSFPAVPGSWVPLVKAWGIDRAREWAAQHFADSMHTFDRDVRRMTSGAALNPSQDASGAPLTRRGAAWREKHSKDIMIAVAQREERAKAESRVPRTVTSTKTEPQPAGRVETIEEFLARGGRVTKLVGAGSANAGQVVA